MTPEKNTDQLPEPQRELELAWIDLNTPLFSAKESGYFGLIDRPAIIVNAATKPLSEAPLFTYTTKDQMKHFPGVDNNLPIYRSRERRTSNPRSGNKKALDFSRAFLSLRERRASLAHV